MSFKRALIITLICLGGLITYGLLRLGSEPKDFDSIEAQVPELGKLSASKPSTNNSPISGIETNVPEDDVEIDKEQIAAAKQLIVSHTDLERVEGVERLSAYPNPEVEQLLVELLVSDKNPEVRKTAALSLGSLDTPSDLTINKLVGAMEDPNESVRFASLTTLEDFMLDLDRTSETAKSIMAGLQTKANSQSTPLTIKDAIRQLLKGLEHPAAQTADPED